MARKTPRFRIGIVGSYGGLNLGDEAILQGIVTQLRQSLEVEITVFSRDPQDTLRRHAVEHALPARELSRSELISSVDGLDALVVGGGGLLFDSEARQFLREAEVAMELEVPVVIYAIGVGPLAEPTIRKLVRDCVERSTVLTVRERGALRLLEEAGVRREVRVTADPALLLTPEPLPEEMLAREGLAERGPVVGLSVREPGGAAPDISEDSYHELLANAADYMVDRFGASIVFVPMERGVCDVQHSHAVISRMLRAQNANVLKGSYTAGQLLSLIARFDFAVGMRLHFLIFAALAGVPFVALPYSAKVGGFLEQVEIQMPPLQQVNAGRLIAHIDQYWDHRRAVRQRVQRNLRPLQQRAKETNELLVNLLTGPAAAEAGVR